ncbi:MAG TPA: peroxiredoxin [Solirubrobacteraceae bacterium]|nr:peroxiredoxin [Solirubrobacteraceae bacterium]
MSCVGRPAPGFHNLPSTKNAQRLDEPVSLEDYAGRWLVLLFYSADFSAVCPSELLAFSRATPDFEALGAGVLALSTDSVLSHQACIEFVLGRLNFPLASDPTHAVSRAYGVLREDEGVAEHALFVIDPEGTIRYEVTHDPGTGRSVQEVSRILQSLVRGSSCPADWQPGQPPLLSAAA